MEQFPNPLRYLILTALTLILFWVLYATIVFIFTSILAQSIIIAMIVSLQATLLFMVFGRTAFSEKGTVKDVVHYLQCIFCLAQPNKILNKIFNYNDTYRVYKSYSILKEKYL